MSELEEIKSNLDSELAEREDVTAVGFGTLLYEEFVKCGWIKYEKLDYAWAWKHDRWPIYDGRYHASPWPNIPPRGYSLPLPLEEPEVV